MTTLNQTTAPRPAPSKDGAELLDALVEDHLQRTAGPFDADPPVPENLQAPEPLVLTQSDIPSSLQQEIDALLAGTPSHNAPIEPALQSPINTDGVSDEELAVLLPDLQTQISAAETENSSPTLPEDTGITSDEMTALSAELAPTIETPEAATSSPAAPSVESDEQLRQAEATLEQELENIMSGSALSAAPAAENIENTNTPAPVEPPAPTEPVTFESAIPEATITSIDPPITIELLPTERKPSAIAIFFHDLFLLIAQLFDMPFHWIDTLDKNILGFIAFLFLLSGLALIAAARWMNR